MPWEIRGRARTERTRWRGPSLKVDLVAFEFWEGGTDASGETAVGKNREAFNPNGGQEASKTDLLR